MTHIPPRPTQSSKDGTYVYTQGHWWFRRRHDGNVPSPESPGETGTCLPEGGYWFRRLDDDEVSNTLTAPNAFSQRQRGEAVIHSEKRGFQRLPAGTSLLPVSDRAEVTYVHEDGVWYQLPPLDEDKERGEEEAEKHQNLSENRDKDEETDEDSDEDKPDDSASAGEGPSVPLPEPHEEPEEEPEEETPAGNIRLTPHMPPSEDTP